MRLTLSYGFVVASLALGACGGGASGKANKEDLAKAVIEALSKKDKAAFSGLYVSIDSVISACPDMAADKDKLAERFAKTLAKANESFDTCAGLDWSKAKPLETKGGDLREPLKECPSVTRVRDIEVLAEIDGKKVTIQLDDPVKVKDGFFLSDRFECDVEGADAAKAPEPTPEPAKEAAPEPAKEAAPEPAKEAAAVPTEPAGGAEKPAGESVGNLSCDKFIASFEKCSAALPEAARGPAGDSVKQMRDSWSQVPDKSMLTGACDQAFSSMKQSMGSLCPGVFE